MDNDSVNNASDNIGGTSPNTSNDTNIARKLTPAEKHAQLRKQNNEACYRHRVKIRNNKAKLMAELTALENKNKELKKLEHDLSSQCNDIRMKIRLHGIEKKKKSNINT